MSIFIYKVINTVRKLLISLSTSHSTSQRFSAHRHLYIPCRGLIVSTL
ncbi:MAG: hypothetical protein HDS44_03720 [Bacteroides sp.]|nr:hypothetical protein [Bacteroides sp.]